MLVLARFGETIAIVPLRLQLLTACMAFLQRAMAAPGAVSGKKSLQASFGGSVGNLMFTVLDNTCRQPAFSMDSIATSGAVSGKQPCRQALVVANTCKLCFYVPDASQGFLL